MTFQREREEREITKTSALRGINAAVCGGARFWRCRKLPEAWEFSEHRIAQSTSDSLCSGSYRTLKGAVFSRLPDIKKGQLKIQEMAFVLVALIVFFALVALAYLSFQSAQLEERVEGLRKSEAQATVRVLASFPELSWGRCVGCIDSDKAFAFSEKTNNASYRSLLGEFDYFVLEIVYAAHGQQSGDVCSAANYPACNRIVFVESRDFGITSEAFVNVCRWEQQDEVCSLGKLYVSGREVKR